MLIISRHKYERLTVELNNLRKANETLRAQIDSLTAENQMLIMEAAGSNIDFPNSSKEHKCSVDKIY